MFAQALSKSLRLYQKNFMAALGFAILLASVILFSAASSVFVSSGSIFLSFSPSQAHVADVLVRLASIAAFLLFYSFFLTVLIFSVRKELSTVKLDYYLTEALRKFSFKLFRFFVVLVMALYAVQAILTFIGVPFALTLLFLFLVSLFLLFVPQAIVVDELSVRSSIASNRDFIRTHPGQVLFVLLLGSTLLFILSLLEFAVDRSLLFGNYVSLLLSMLFVLPFVEIVKSYLYVTGKFGLIGGHEKHLR